MLFRKFRTNPDENALQVNLFVLRYFSVQHTCWRIKNAIADHLEPHSLLALKDILNEYGVESIAIRKGQYSYDNFETPFVCAIQKEDWPNAAFTIVTACSPNTVSYLNPISNSVQIDSLEEFEKMDKEIILLLDASNKKDEIDYLKNRKTEKTENFLSRLPIYSFILMVLLSLISQLRVGKPWISSFFLITSTLGLFISLLLIWYEVDAHNPFIKEVCGSGKRNRLNCNAILSSTGSRFLGISWSIWGFSYFATFFICQIFFSGEQSYLEVWAFLSLALLIYVPYSFYYQARIVKQWCPLCLAIQAVIVINAAAGAMFLLQLQYDSLLFPLQSVLTIFFLWLSLLLGTYYVVPLIKSAKSSHSYEKRWKKLRFNPDIFRSLLEKSNAITVSPNELGVVLGNLDAKTEIIKVCNPYCGPCSKAHPELEHIIKSNLDVRLSIIFTADGKDARTPPVLHFLAIQDKYGDEKIQQALDDWYMNPRKDYKKFAKKYPMNGEQEWQMDKVLAMRRWCDAMKIRSTPTIFVNGYELPDGYRIAELKNFF